MSRVSSATRSQACSLLLKAAGFALAAATVIPAAAVPVTALNPYTVNAIPTANTAIPLFSSPSGPFTNYYAFSIGAPAGAFGISLISVGFAFPSWSAEVYQSDSACISSASTCNLVGSAFAVLSQTGNSLYLPTGGGGFVNAPTVPGTYVVKVTGTGVSGSAYIGNVATAIPAPAALGLLGIGLLGMGLTRRRRGA